MTLRILSGGKTALLRLVSAVTGRHAVLLPREAAPQARLLKVDAPYRIENGRLDVRLMMEGSPGMLAMVVMGYEGHFPTRELFRARGIACTGSDSIEVDFSTGRIRVAGREQGAMAKHASSRRFALSLSWSEAGGGTRQRTTGHYLVGEVSRGEDYFSGQTYVDHESESGSEARAVIEKFHAHGARGPVLEVGCATGRLLEALREHGVPQSFGVDVSQWAVDEANRRLGQRGAWACDVERDELPAELLSNGPFGTVVMWAVYEHLRDPILVLQKLAAACHPGATLLINTTNANSLARFLFGRQWEGYFDPTHFGVEDTGVESLQRDLPTAGWRILDLETRLVWDGCIDPLHSTLRDWYTSDARFRELLRERGLGDFVQCVARRD
jgi:SAM-dependent methyltransferase